MNGNDRVDFFDEVFADIDGPCGVEMDLVGVVEGMGLAQLGLILGIELEFVRVVIWIPQILIRIHY